MTWCYSGVSSLGSTDIYDGDEMEEFIDYGRALLASRVTVGCA